MNWTEGCCGFCGEGSTVFISISIDFPDPEGDERLNYTQTDLCKECWEKYGIQAAFDHNNQLREAQELPLLEGKIG